MRTAITLTKTHAGKWALASTPDDSMIVQKAAFVSLRVSRHHKDFAEVVYQESDGHRQTLHLMTPDAHEKLEKQSAMDLSEAKKWDEEAAKLKNNDPERLKMEKEFAAKTKAADDEEKKLAKSK